MVKSLIKKDLWEIIGQLVAARSLSKCNWIQSLKKCPILKSNPKLCLLKNHLSGSQIEDDDWWEVNEVSVQNKNPQHFLLHLHLGMSVLLFRYIWHEITTLQMFTHKLQIRERPLMTSDFRVGRGVQNDPKNWTF